MPSRQKHSASQAVRARIQAGYDAVRESLTVVRGEKGQRIYPEYHLYVLDQPTGVYRCRVVTFEGTESESTRTIYLPRIYMTIEVGDERIFTSCRHIELEDEQARKALKEAQQYIVIE